MKKNSTAEKPKSGFIFLDKPVGCTSHDVIDKLRKITGIKKIGHAGTLDPQASGVLIIGVGRQATKKLSYFLKQEKEYWAKIRLGAVSTTFDAEGEIKLIRHHRKPTKSEVKEALGKFVGVIQQIPPIFSAKKVAGKAAYKLARANKPVKLKPQTVKISQLKLLGFSYPYLEIKVVCSSGTYIRSLANDIGETLGCGGYLVALRRTRIGKIKVEDTVSLNKISSNNWYKFLWLEHKSAAI